MSVLRAARVQIAKLIITYCMSYSYPGVLVPAQGPRVLRVLALCGYVPYTSTYACVMAAAKAAACAMRAYAHTRSVNIAIANSIARAPPVVPIPTNLTKLNASATVD